MANTTIDRLIINSPYEEPAQHWHYDRQQRTFRIEAERRPAGYVVASPDSRSFDDPGIFRTIPLVNDIRARVKAWREAGYPGASAVTRRLLAHWHSTDEAEDSRFFFCQLEAAETLIWHVEAPPQSKAGIDIPSDGGEFERICAKMATGAGKTVVMAMVIAWQVLNKVAHATDRRFAKNVLVVAPGLTVKSRLRVLEPADPANYYEAFRVVPPAMMDKLRQGTVLVHNWQALNWETEERVAKRRSVDKRGVRSDEAYVRGVLGTGPGWRNLLVINDEAHHAWRVSAQASTRGVAKATVEEATKWVGALDRIHRVRHVLRCYDFSATPFAPSGGASSEETLFDWIVSDFGLNDAIEAGLVKTPRVVVRDDALPDARTYKSRLYHLYNDPEVKDDLSRAVSAEQRLPDLVLNAYYLLGYDWRETAKRWAEEGAARVPALITVANRTETAARVKNAFDRQDILIPELCDPEGILHIDSKVLAEAESAVDALALDTADSSNGQPRRSNAKSRAEFLRRQVDTVGEPGQPGGAIQNVISVGMLSEGWDAKTVTHIMGLRAFASQLLCEQVVGRGLRRTTYDVSPETGLFEPEYVNVFGVPFTFLPHEGSDDGTVPPPPKPKTEIRAAPEKAAFEIRWPNVVRIDRVFQPRLHLDWSKVETLTIDASTIPRIADMAPIVEGKPNVTEIATIDLEPLAREFRLQRIAFVTAAEIFDEMKANWPGNREMLLAQLVRLTEAFLASDRIVIEPRLFATEDLRRRLVLVLSMTRVLRHIWHAIRCENTAKRLPVFDDDHPIRTTGDMAPWFTAKPCEYTQHSHINHCVYDSTWEAYEAHALDRSELVDAWVKNDHLGFEVFYVHGGVVRKYRPDFLIRLRTGTMLVLEVKGREREEDKTKRRHMAEWCKAVNQHGGFGRWECAVSWRPSDIHEVLTASSGDVRG